MKNDFIGKMDEMYVEVRRSSEAVELKEEPKENDGEIGRQVHFNCSVKEEQEDVLIDFEAYWKTQDLKEEWSANEFAEQQNLKEDDEEVKPPLAVFLEPYEDDIKKETIFEEDPLVAENEVMKDMVDSACEDSSNDSQSVRESFSDHMSQARSPAKQELSRLKKMYPEQTLFYDDQCQKRFVTSDKFSGPQKSNITKTDSDAYEKKFFIKNKLPNHVQKHTIEKTFKCDTCAKSFARKRYLNNHKKIHTGKRVFHCGICTKSFLHKYKLTNHLNTHSGDRPYQCDICSKSFVHQYKLTSHIKTHTGDRPYQCGICLKGFLEKRVLINHMMTHTGERPHQCDICPKSFARKALLTYHMKTHTGERPTNVIRAQKVLNKKDSLEVT